MMFRWFRKPFLSALSAACVSALSAGAFAQSAPLQDTQIFTAPAGVPSAHGGPTYRGEISVVRERSFGATAPSMTGSTITLTSGNTARDGLFSESIYFRTGPVINNARDPETQFTVTFPAGVTVVGVISGGYGLDATHATWGLAPAINYTAYSIGTDTLTSDTLRVAAGAGGTTVVTVRTSMNVSPHTDDFRILIDYGTAFTAGVSMRIAVAIGDDVNVGGAGGGRTGEPRNYTVDVPLTLGCTADQDGDRVPDCLDGTVDTDGDGRRNYLDPDDDGDGVPTTNELGVSAAMPNNSDGAVPAGQGTSDTIPDWLDADDDGDGVRTATELGTGGFGSPRNSDAMPPMGGGTADTVPDYLDRDDDGDGIFTATEVTLDTSTGDDFDSDGLPSYRDWDSDADGLLDRTEGTGDTNMNMRPDFLDPSDDSDGDGVPNAVERGGCMGSVAGCVMGDRDTDRDGAPDYLDPDDDGDGIPTAVERSLDPSMGDDFDGDGVPSYRDTDSDGDADLDREEAGATPVTPVNTDRAADGPDFLDLDSDNDCAPDSVMSEDGVARITVAMSPNANCMEPASVCDTTRGVCVACLADVGSAVSGCGTNENGTRCLAGATVDTNACGCATSADCPADRDCNVAVMRCEPRMMGSDGGADSSADASMSDGSTDTDSGVVNMDGSVVTDGAMLADATSSDGAVFADAALGDGTTADAAAFAGLLTGSGACACRVDSAPTRGPSRGALSAIAALGVLAMARLRRRSTRR